MLSTEALREQLTDKQRQAIDLLIGGTDYNAIASQVNVHVTRVSKWKRDAVFKELLARASAEVSKEAIRIAAANSSKAVQKCVECLEAENSSWKEKLQAANLILKQSQINIDLVLETRVEALERKRDKQKEQELAQLQSRIKQLEEVEKAYNEAVQKENSKPGGRGRKRRTTSNRRKKS